MLLWADIELNGAPNPVYLPTRLSATHSRTAEKRL